MCLILVAFRAHPAYTLIVAANRDEAYARPATPASFWTDHPGILAGRDQEKGGTWLGLSRQGRFAAVTNYRQGQARSVAPRSRGDLPAGQLAGTEETTAYLARVQRDSHLYNGYSLIAGDLGGLYFFSNRGGAHSSISPISPGVHGLSNHLLDEPWPKVRHGTEVLGSLLAAPEADITATLFQTLADRTPAVDQALPATGVERQRERELSPIFIAAERYGTRASTVLLVSAAGDVYFSERSYGPGGASLGATEHRFTLDAPPLTAPAADKASLRAC
jgi:uncharacterized protein with NRDE domain